MRTENGTDTDSRSRTAELRDELVRTTRKLNEAVALTGESDIVLARTIDDLRSAVDRLGRTRLPDVPRTTFDDAVGATVYRWQYLNPAVSPMTMTFDDSGVCCRIDDGGGPLHQGPPGVLHGGDAASMLDVALSSLTQFHGIRCVTAVLTTTFHAPVGSSDPLVVQGKIDSVDGRKIWAVGEISVHGVVRVSARALFVEIA